jgi:hypothetical protein
VEPSEPIYSIRLRAAGAVACPQTVLVALHGSQGVRPLETPELAGGTRGVARLRQDFFLFSDKDDAGDHKYRSNHFRQVYRPAHDSEKSVVVESQRREHLPGDDQREDRCGA